MTISDASKIKGVLTFLPDVYYDHRGENCETFNAEAFQAQCGRFNVDEVKFVVDSFSFSTKNVLRGFHGDTKTWKLVQCLQGAIQLSVIDIRPESKTVGKTDTFFLNDKNRMQLLIPAGCVNAHLCLSDTCIFGYKLSHGYVRQEDQLLIKWNDPQYSVYWPVTNPILSKRDS
jgi:dTDP-4-dehydrorhamnose 3,5-epimerase